jgi:hypothetical protein
MAKKNQRIIETQRELPSAIDIKTGARRIKEKHASRRAGRLKNKKSARLKGGRGSQIKCFQRSGAFPFRLNRNGAPALCFVVSSDGKSTCAVLFVIPAQAGIQ